MNFSVVKAETAKEINDFINLPKEIYKDCPYYIPDLDLDVRAMLNVKTNPSLKNSIMQLFVAYDLQHKPVGRIVGIINRKANSIWNSKYVRFGMIEFIDREEVSLLLLNAVEEWGRSYGMEKIQGPMGITDFDKEGMLLEDFDQEGSMISIYNPPYYPKHIERLGYEKEVDWLQVKLEIPEQLPERFKRTVSIVRNMYDLKVKKLTRHDVFKGGYAKKIFKLLNEAYKPLFGFSELSQEQCKKILDQYFPLADLRMIPVVEDHDGNVLAVAITIGSLNNALRKSKGRLLPLGWLHLLKSLKFKHEDKVEMLLMAVDPEYQGFGINALIFEYLIPVYNELGYKWAETGPMLEHNLKVQTQWKHLNHQVYKRRRCYCKVL